MCLAVGVAGFLVSFGTSLPGYSLLYRAIPLLHGIRATNRFGYLVIVGVATLAGFALAELRRRWRDRSNLPLIKEVRLVEVAKVYNVVEAFQQGSLHILPDVPTGDLDKFRNALGARVEVVTAATNRRVYMLAVNHRRPQMQSKALRQGLSLAIDRESILSDVYRAGKSEYHKQMGGPFPPRSWAAVKAPGGNTIPLANRDLAVTRLKTYLGDMGAKAEVTLSYPDGDRLAALACNKIKAQVESLFKDLPGRKP